MPGAKAMAPVSECLKSVFSSVSMDMFRIWQAVSEPQTYSGLSREVKNGLLIFVRVLALGHLRTKPGIFSSCRRTFPIV